MGALTKSEILALQPAAPILVNVPEWGMALSVRMLTGTERDAVFAASVGAGNDGRGHRARLISAAASAADGTTFTVEELSSLDDTQPAVILRLFVAAQRINKLGSDDVEAAAGN